MNYGDFRADSLANTTLFMKVKVLLKNKGFSGGIITFYEITSKVPLCTT